jgi:hypothetical protein
MEKDFNNSTKLENGDRAKMMSPRIKKVDVGQVKVGLCEDQQF